MTRLEGKKTMFIFSSSSSNYRQTDRQSVNKYNGNDVCAVSSRLYR